MKCFDDDHGCHYCCRRHTVFLVAVVPAPTLLARVPARIDRDGGGIVEFGGNSYRSGLGRTTAAIGKIVVAIAIAIAIAIAKVTAIAIAFAIAIAIALAAAPPTSKSAPAAPADEYLEPNDPPFCCLYCIVYVYDDDGAGTSALLLNRSRQLGKASCSLEDITLFDSSSSHDTTILRSTAAETGSRHCRVAFSVSDATDADWEYRIDLKGASLVLFLGKNQSKARHPSHDNETLLILYSGHRHHTVRSLIHSCFAGRTQGKNQHNHPTQPNNSRLKTWESNRVIMWGEPEVRTTTMDSIRDSFGLHRFSAIGCFECIDAFA
jgi:hypothetical protein